MSATGRTPGVREAADFYSTPRWCTEAILPHLRLDAPGLVLEPAAGDGAMVRVLLDAGVPKEKIVAIEKDDLRADACRTSLGVKTMCDDSLAVVWDGISLCITNPPYRLAQRFMEKGITDVVMRGGTLCLLLRINILASQKRAVFWKRCPADVYVLSKRPSFTGKGSDATEYSWIVWSAETLSRGHGRWFILDLPANVVPVERQRLLPILAAETNGVQTDLFVRPSPEALPAEADFDF